jgi:formiminoglutamase
MASQGNNTEDELWPRAAGLLAQVQSDERLDVAVLGVPTHRNSISPSNANQTPAAIRAALRRYSTLFSSDSQEIGDLAQLRWGDFGDMSDPDSPAGEEATAERVASLLNQASLAITLGGDNSLTFPVARGLQRHLAPAEVGLITLDAHHDLRDGISNGSPVRRLIEAGFNPERIVQIGIADFSNSPQYSRRAADLGIRVISRAQIEEKPLAEIVAEAAAIAGDNFHLDIDVDVCDRSFVPATPAAAPGGITAHQLRQFARLFARQPGLRSADIAEISATDDAPDGRTVRLGALLVLELAAGFALRGH